MPLFNGAKRVAHASKKEGECCSPHGCCCSQFGKKIIATLVGVMLVYLIFFLGTLVRNNIKKYDTIGRMDATERMITVSGLGKVTGANDIAVTTIGHSTVNKDVAKAQEDNKKIMDAVAADLAKMSIAENDLQTNYSIYPEYNYTSSGGTELKGYRVTHSITVKIRDLSKINAVLGLAGKYGATEISGLSFTIDDASTLKDKARIKALADAQKKARLLAAQLGVRLSELISYSEYDSSNDSYYPKYYGIGGAEGGGGAPESVSGGSKDVVMNVSVTYKISTPSRW